MWYNQLEGERNIIEKLSYKFGKHDMKKSKLEVGHFKGCFMWREKQIQGSQVQSRPGPIQITG